MIAQQLLTPSSVALIGASLDPLKASSRPWQYLRESRYPGRVYAINPARAQGGDLPIYARLADLPEVPDHAYIMVSTNAVAAAVRDCAEAGVPIATIMAAGFADVGPDGLALLAEVRDIARAGNVRLVGPSSLGIVNLRTDMRLTGNAIFAERDLPVGGTVILSQSGSMIGGLMTRGRHKGLGFAAAISVGGEVDLTLGEIGLAVLDDPTITDFLVFLEAMDHADTFQEFAAAAHAHGKPIVAYKVGRSAAGAALTVTHSGALAGEDDVASEFLADCGVARVDTLDGLLEAERMLRSTPISTTGRAPTVGVVTTTGGGAAMVVDQLGVRGVDVVQPSADTYRRLADAGVSVVEGRIVDLTLAGTRPDVMTAALRVLTEAPEFETVVAVVGSSARLQPHLAVAPIRQIAAEGRSVAAFLVPDAPEARQDLLAADVPVFDTPEACADVVAATLSRRPPRVRDMSDLTPDATRVLDEADGYRVLGRVGLAVAPHRVIEVSDVEQLTQEHLGIDFPVVVKAVHPDLHHKSDVGGVVLGVTSADGLVHAIRTISDSVPDARPGIRIDRVLVQPHLTGVGEVLIAYRRDRQFGPIVILAAGGRLTELLEDRTVRMAPVDRATALEMLDEVRSTKLITGYRGGDMGDREAVIDAIVAMSRLADDHAVIEAEVNPLIVMQRGRGAWAADALVTVADEATTRADA